jgi:hypothetical protein
MGLCKARTDTRKSATCRWSVTILTLTFDLNLQRQFQSACRFIAFMTSRRIAERWGVSKTVLERLAKHDLDRVDVCSYFCTKNSF